MLFPDCGGSAIAAERVKEYRLILEGNNPHISLSLFHTHTYIV